MYYKTISTLYLLWEFCEGALAWPTFVHRAKTDFSNQSWRNFEVFISKYSQRHASCWNNYESYYWTEPDIYHGINRRLSKWKISFDFRNITRLEIRNCQCYKKNKPLAISLSLTLLKVALFWAGSCIFWTWLEAFKTAIVAL